MASIKVKFRPSAVAGREGSIYYQVIHGRKTRQILSNYHILPSEWDVRRSMVRVPSDEERHERVLTVCELVKCDLLRLNRIVRLLETNGGEFTCDDIVDAYHRYSREGSLFNYMSVQIVRLKRNGRLRMSEIYRTTLNSFRRFREGKDIMLDNITTDIMEAYEAWGIHIKNYAPNTISFYLRNLRAVYRRAVEEEIIIDRNPFRRVYNGIDKTVKRALPLALLRKIGKLDLSKNPGMEFARDMFMLSFMLRGMSIVDMAFLRKIDLKEGYVCYRRRKTGQRLMIAWTAEMQRILDKYGENPTDYMLPILRKSSGRNDRWRYLSMANKINRNLKKVGKMVGAKIPVTMYVARHSWASAAKHSGIPISVICEGMGHDSESTTQIYLASLDTAVVDQANTLLIRKLLG